VLMQEHMTSVPGNHSTAGELVFRCLRLASR
jgi:hypothetical protein